MKLLVALGISLATAFIICSNLDSNTVKASVMPDINIIHQELVKEDGYSYWVNSDGERETGLINIDGKDYMFTGVHTIDGDTYYYDSYAELETGRF